MEVGRQETYMSMVQENDNREKVHNSRAHNSRAKDAV